MTIEVTVPVQARVAISFDVDPGTVITQEMINEKIDAVQAEIGGTLPANEVYVEILDVEFDSFDRCLLDLYNRDTGADKQIYIGGAAQ